MGRFVVITGLPASGKSDTGRIVAAALAVPLLDKDDFLEPLFRQAELPDAVGRRQLSQLADESFRARALAQRDAILVSWWRHPRSQRESGTPSSWLSLLPGPVVEIHCICKPIVAVERFLARKRHPGHLDADRSHAQLLEQFSEQALLGPLGTGHLIEVRTDEPLDIKGLHVRLGSAFGICRQ